MVVGDGTPEGLYPFEAPHMVDRFLKKAEDELYETSENKENGLEQLRDIIFSASEVRCRTTDDFLVQFLRARKFNVPKSYSLLKKYMGFKRKNANIFTGMVYDNIVKLITSRTIRILPYRDREGCVVIAAHLDNWIPSECPIEELSRTLVLFLYHSINDPVSQINGYKVLLDVKSASIKHLRIMTPQNLYLLYSGTQECFPGRFKGIHIVNMSYAFKVAWHIVRPLLSEKLKKRIIFHDKSDSLKEYFPDSLLPVDFGGKLIDPDNTQWIKRALTPENLERLAN